MDYDAYQKSLKSLYIIFIILIVITNGLNIHKILNNGGMLKSPRRFLLFTLSAGDLFLALYSLVVDTRVVFESDDNPFHCFDVFISRVIYSHSFLPFVYAVSLMVLCVELKKRRAIISLTHSLYLSIGITAIPWMFGLLVTVPLNLAGLNIFNCNYGTSSYNLERLQATVVVSQLVPAILACVVVFIWNHKKSDAVLDIYADQPSEPGHDLSTQGHQANNMQCGIVTARAIQEIETNKSLSVALPSYFEDSQQTYYWSQAYPQHPQNQHVQPLQTRAQYQPHLVVMGAQQPMTSWIDQPSHDNNDVISQSSHDISDVTRSVKKEESALGKVAVLNAALTLPLAIFRLEYIYNENKELLEPHPEAAIAYYTGLTFLFYSRSFITPIIWMKSILEIESSE